MPKGVEMRPTQDKVRGAIFNILGDIIEEDEKPKKQIGYHTEIEDHKKTNKK